MKRLLSTSLTLVLVLSNGIALGADAIPVASTGIVARVKGAASSVWGAMPSMSSWSLRKATVPAATDATVPAAPAVVPVLDVNAFNFASDFNKALQAGDYTKALEKVTVLNACLAATGTSAQVKVTEVVTGRVYNGSKVVDYTVNGQNVLATNNIVQIEELLFQLGLSYEQCVKHNAVSKAEFLAGYLASLTDALTHIKTHTSVYVGQINTALKAEFAGDLNNYRSVTTAIDGICAEISASTAVKTWSTTSKVVTGVLTTVAIAAASTGSYKGQTIGGALRGLSRK
jgi:hypothetical protein